MAERTCGLLKGAIAAVLGSLITAGAAYAQAVPLPGGGDGLDIPGSQISSQHLANTQFDNLSFDIYRRIAWFTRGNGPGATQTSFKGSATGLSAGNGGRQNGLWASIALNRLTDDTTGLQTEGTTVTGLFAYDRLFWDDRVLLGIGLVADGSQFTTSYNAGDLTSRSIGVVPYVAWRATDALTLNLLFNYSRGSTDTSRIDGTGALATGEFSTDRWFVEGGADYAFTSGNWSFIAQTWLSYGQLSEDSYTESNGNNVGDQTIVLGTWRIGGQAGYTFTLDEKGRGFAEPYVYLNYELDYRRTKIRVPTGRAGHENDTDQINVGGGVNFFVGDSWSASLEGSGAIGREEIDNWILSATLRYQF